MKSNSIRTVLSSLLLVATGIFCTTPASIGMAQEQRAYRPAAGQMHPDFSLPSIEDGSAVKLSDFRGKKVLLFHFASW
jgi:hypothetical protein